MAEQAMLTYVEAMNAAIKEEMRRDERVVLWGEDIVSMGGAFATTAGIFEEFGEDRIKDTPIVEAAIVDMTIGAALGGLKPIGFLMFAGLVGCCFEAIFNKLGAYRQQWGYEAPLPVVIHSAVGTGGGFGADHDLSPEALLMHSPGLKIVLPSTVYDAKGLLKAAIRDDEPVIYLANRNLYFGKKQPIPNEEYVIPLGKADIKREGTDVTIVAYSFMAVKALDAAEVLGKEGISVEVVDLRSLNPLDVEAIVKSVKKTGRLLIAHEAMKRAGAAGEIAFRVLEAAPDVVKAMKTPIKRLAAKNVAIPFGSGELERELLPQVDDVVKAVKEMA